MIYSVIKNHLQLFPIDKINQLQTLILIGLDKPDCVHRINVIVRIAQHSIKRFFLIEHFC